MIRKLFITCLILLCLGLITVYTAGSILSNPRQGSAGIPPDDLAISNVTFQSKSGALISGWYIAGEKKKGGILLMHGVRSNRLQMLNRARFLSQAGYSVLLFDFQAHGESIGKHITFGYLEALDAEAAYSWLNNKLTNKTIGVIGVSLGGAATLLGEVSKQAKALILESVYPTIEEAIANRLRLRLGSLGKSVMPLLTWQIEPRLGFKTEQLRPIEHIAKTSAAILIITGDKDQHTPLAESKRLYKAANKPKQLWIIEGAAHINFDRYRPDLYKTKVLNFFNDHLNP
jgi:fermentation-respiration switch protein FrsA (DUF1100 family)